jgi:hypothetical protein
MMTDQETRIMEEIPTAATFLEAQLATITDRIDDVPARTLPRNNKLHVLDSPQRVMLIALDTERSPLLLDLMGGVVLGHSEPIVDVDLSLWGAEEAAVSREHALLRPRPDRLYVIDKESTNGTYKNGLPLSPSRAYELESEDILTLGRLHLGVQLL